jgi:hypothetical protein
MPTSMLFHRFYIWIIVAISLDLTIDYRLPIATVVSLVLESTRHINTLYLLILVANRHKTPLIPYRL